MNFIEKLTKINLRMEELVQKDARTEEELAELAKLEADKAVVRAEMDAQARAPKLEVVKPIGLMKVLRSIANPTAKVDDETAAIIEAGRTEARSAGIATYSEGVFLPLNMRASITAAGNQSAIQSDVLNLEGPLRDALAAVKAGATFMDGLVGNITFPVYSGAQAYWATENGEAPDGAGTITTITMSPKRITTFMDVSNQMLAQDSIGAENLFKKDLVDAVADLLNKTIFGNGAVSATQPKGIFNGTTAGSELSWSAVTDLIGNIGEANALTDNAKFVTHPQLMARMMSTPTGVASTGFIANTMGLTNSIGPYPLIASSGVAKIGSAYGIAFGDFSEMIIGKWGGVQVLVDPYTQAGKGITRFVISIYTDAIVKRDKAIVRAALPLTAAVVK